MPECQITDQDMVLGDFGTILRQRGVDGDIAGCQIYRIGCDHDIESPQHCLGEIGGPGVGLRFGVSTVLHVLLVNGVTRKLRLALAGFVGGAPGGPVGGGDVLAEQHTGQLRCVGGQVRCGAIGVEAASLQDSGAVAFAGGVIGQVDGHEGADLPEAPAGGNPGGQVGVDADRPEQSDAALLLRRRGG